MRKYSNFGWMMTYLRLSSHLQAAKLDRFITTELLPAVAGENQRTGSAAMI